MKNLNQIKPRLVAVCLFFIANMAFAQTTNVEVTDASANSFTAINPATKQPDTTKVAVRISCNIQNLKQAKHLHGGYGNEPTTVWKITKP